ncbi:MAG TPA: tail fiber assembly protein [Flavobacteriales bacterium]|nr:tail fiber assembly protein [Flavobacteriales bacterium]
MATKRNVIQKAKKPEVVEPVETPLEPNPEFIAHTPGKKKVFAYNEDGTFAGATEAHESPLEKGVFHMPARTTEVQPISPKDGFIVKFSPSKQIWIYEPTKVEEAPKEDTAQAEEIKKKQNIAMRNGLLLDSDYTQLPDVAMSEKERKAWAEYRQALRDMSKQKGWPLVVEWPEKPVK